MSEYTRPIDRIREERRAAARARMRSRRLTRLVVGIAAGALLLAGGLGLALTMMDDEAAAIMLPGNGDHWHARYRVEIDGQELAIFPPSDGDIHSHGDGLVHIHPHSDATAGHAATLSAFFTSLGGELTDASLRLPDGRTFGQDAVQILVDDDPLTGWASYVPQDGDQIEIIITTGAE